MFCDSSWELWLHSMVCPWAREVTRNAAAVAGAKGQKTSAFAFFLHVEVTAEGGHKRSALCSQLCALGEAVRSQWVHGSQASPIHGMWILLSDRKAQAEGAPGVK